MAGPLFRERHATVCAKLSEHVRGDQPVSAADIFAADLRALPAWLAGGCSGIRWRGMTCGGSMGPRPGGMCWVVALAAAVLACSGFDGADDRLPPLSVSPLSE